jgi:hypothetical protein
MPTAAGNSGFIIVPFGKIEEIALMIAPFIGIFGLTVIK